MRKYTLLIITLFISFIKLHSSDVKGTEFIATFLPNFHNNWSYGKDLGDSVYLFIYAEKLANINIQYYNQKGQFINDSITVPSNSIYTFKKNSYEFALLGFNESGDISSRNNSERICNMSFRVKSDQPIIIYGHSQANTTSESFNVLPIETLGNEYIVAAYNASKWIASGFNGVQTTPSQFAIVAIDDSTEVAIEPSVDTRFNKKNKQAITLNKNEVYLVQSDISPNNTYLDLTGSYIKSNKPVAVFGGQQRAAVPYDIAGSSPSRDYIVEQIPPLEAWNLQAYVVPFPQPTNIETTIPDLFRVIAGFNNTDIYIDDVYYATINKGEFVELPLNKSCKVRGSSPILAVSYKRTSQTNGGNSNGDPLMQIVPSIDQYGNNYKFINIQAYEKGSFGINKVYTEHFITIIIPYTSLKSIVFDGTTLVNVKFTKIEGTDYYYGYLKVNEGIHSISAPDNFGLFICGYGNANSYGYYSGIISKRDDFEPPTFQTNSDCDKINGIVEDLKIASVIKDDSKTKNINVTIDNFKPYVKKINFKAELINKKLDGTTRIIAKDSIGQQNFIDINIPGFTLGLLNAIKIDQSEPIFVYDTLQLNEKKCYKFTIKNYGNYEQNITKSLLKSNVAFTTNLPNTFKLNPNETKDFTVCFNADHGDTFIDTLYIENNCNNQDFIIFNLLSKDDDKNPELTSKIDKCNKLLSIIITDSARTDRGIKNYIINQKDNLQINEISKSKSIIKLEASVIDSYQDAYLSITVIDSVGHTIIYNDTIPGFTITLGTSINNPQNKLDFGNTKIGVNYCKSITLTNYGKFDFILDNIHLTNNIYFSIPLNQLPLTIKSGESKDLTICYQGYNASTFPILDTLMFNFNCLYQKLAIETLSDSLIINNQSRCDVDLIFSSGEISYNNSISKSFPNPATEMINFVINNASLSNIIGRIYDLNGNIVSEYLNQRLDKGSFKITVSTNLIPNGVYINLITINNENFREIFIINR